MCLTCVLCVYMYSATKDDTVLQECLIPAMRRGSLKVVGVSVELENSSSVESILRQLPQSNVEELSIGLYTTTYSEEVSLLCVCVRVHVCVCVCGWVWVCGCVGGWV